MLGERTSFFTRVKAKSKTKPRESMVPSTFAPAAPFSTSVPTVSPILKRVANNIPAPLAPPPKRSKCPKKRDASRLMIRDSEEGAGLSQGSASPLGPATLPAAPLAVMVDLTSSETFSDTGMGLHGDPTIPLQVELSQPFPRRDPAPAPKEFRQRKGKAIMLPGYSGKYLATPYRDPYAAMAQSLKHITQALNGTHVLAWWCDHLARVNHSLGYQIRRAEEVADLTRELSLKKEAAKAWAAEKANLLAERDDAKARYLELERAKDVELYRANQALEQATREKISPNYASKIREFLASPNYASKIHTECAVYLYSLGSDYKSSEDDSSDEEAAGGVEPSTIADGDLEARPSDTNPVLDP
ncbi:hypothetical protein LIER_38502 [Lithospermum erythrorhizon]|uniref:Uncharacterized protein n=1 Tax=Lithospermum erythrorhizon TaxID=34254 RepID=A0AAV3Q193_LITER